MAVGLQIFDANGNIVLDASYRMMRIINSVTLSNGVSGSISDDRLSQGGWVSFQPSTSIGDGYLSGGVIVPRFSISGATLTWSYAGQNSSYDTFQGGTLFYGAY